MDFSKLILYAKFFAGSGTVFICKLLSLLFLRWMKNQVKSIQSASIQTNKAPIKRNEAPIKFAHRRQLQRVTEAENHQVALSALGDN